MPVPSTQQRIQTYREIQKEYERIKEDPALHILTFIRTFESRLEKMVKNITVAQIHQPKEVDEQAIIDKIIPIVQARVKHGKDGDAGVAPTPDEILGLIRPLIPTVQDGKTPSRKELIALIKPLIPVIQAPASPTAAELEAIIRPIVMSMTPTAIEIADKINSMPEAIEMRSIKGVDKTFNKFLRSIKSKQDLVVRGGGDEIFMKDLSILTDGSTMTFVVPKHRRPIALMSSDFPTFLFLNNGFTVSTATTSITLTTDHAPSQGSQLGYVYVK